MLETLLSSCLLLWWSHTRLLASPLAYLCLPSSVNSNPFCGAVIHPGVVIGGDGFGIARRADGSWVKVPQLGGVLIGDDVEIGSNTTIDRGALEDTVIANGVKLDNLIQVAHNVHIGEHTAIAACVAIGGSARIGARCTIGGACVLSEETLFGNCGHYFDNRID